ncbi:MAG: ATP-binding protein [Planctomycetota bacterium]
MSQAGLKTNASVLDSSGSPFKHVLVALRLTIILSLVTTPLAMAGYQLTNIHLYVYIALAIFLLNTLWGYLDYFHLVGRSLMLKISFIVDLAAMTLFIYYAGGSETQQFYLVFLIIILITASIRSAVSAFVATLVGALVYALINTTEMIKITEVIGSGYFLHRVAFLFVVATFIGYLSEETERYKKEQLATKEILTTEIKNLTEYLKNVFQSVPSGIIVLDRDDKITVFNKRAEEILDVNAAEVLGQPIKQITALKEFYRLSADFYKRSSSSDKFSGPASAGRDEITFRRKEDQPPLYIGVGFSLLKDVAGKHKGTISVFQDLTRVKQYEKELLKKEQLALVGQLASAMAHDFFNTLGGLKGIVEFTLNNPAMSLAEAQETLTITKRNLSRSLAIVKNLLNFSRKPEPQLEPVGLNNIINESLELIKHDLDGDGIEVVKKMDEAPRMMSDPNLLQQVFLNLFLNARQAILPNKGKITVEVKNKWDFAEISVSDSGRGIKPEDLKKIFEPFFSTKSGADKSGGMGLGLYVTREIIQTLRGKIEVRSSLIQGTTFTIVLPYS